MITAPANSLKELTSKRTINSKTFDIGNGQSVCCTSLAPAHVPSNLLNYSKKKGFNWTDPNIKVIKRTGFYRITGGWYAADVDIKNISLSYISKSGAKIRMRLKTIGGKLPGAPSRVFEKNGYITWENVSPGIDILLQFRDDRVEWFKRIKDSAAAKTFEWAIIEDIDNKDIFRDKSFGLDNENRTGDKWQRGIVAATTLSPAVTANKRAARIFTETWDGSVIQRDPKTRIKSKYFNPVYPILLDVSIVANITADADDGWEQAGGWQSASLANGLLLSASYLAGWRFTGVAVPQGATVSSATLDLYAVNTRTNNIVATLYGENVDNAVAWTTYAGLLPSNMAKTTASFTTSNTLFDTPGAKSLDVKAIVQEIFNRAGWVLNNALRLAFVTVTSSVYQYLDDYSKAGTPVVGQLNITFTTGAGAIIKVINETLQSIETASTSRALNRAINDMLQVSTSSNAARTLNRHIDETIQTAENTAPIRLITRVINETLGITEGVLNVIAALIIKVINEVMQVSEATHVVRTLKRVISEMLNINESSSTTRVLNRIHNEALNINESRLMARKLNRHIDETVQTVENVAPVRLITRVINETLSIVEQVNKYLLQPIYDCLLATLKMVPALKGEASVVAALKAKLKAKP